MSSTLYNANRPGLIVGMIIASLVLAGALTLLVLYSVTDPTSFYVAVAAIALSPIFVLAAFLVNKQQTK